MAELKDINIFKFLGSIVIGVASSLLNTGAPAGRVFLYGANQLAPNREPDLIEAIRLRQRKVYSTQQYLNIAKINGYDTQRAESVYQAYINTPDIKDYLTLYYRGEISRGRLSDIFEANGFPKGELDNFIKAFQYYATPPDLIRFSVREVYDTSIRAKYGLDDEFPSALVEDAKKIGMDKELAGKYWASHWENPSIQHGYEMLHRRVITESELDDLYRIVDITPFWRDKLTQIAYNPLTRVDVRRMYREGVLDRGQVKESYLDIGYNDEKAEMMTEFTVKWANDSNKGISRANVVNAYRDDIITEGELKQYLKEFGFDDEVVNFWVSQANYDKAMDELKELTKDLEALFIAGAIDITEVRSRLSGANLPTQYVDRIVNRLEARIGAKRKTATKGDLVDWLRKGVIAEGIFRDRMTKIGYTNDDIQSYLTEVNLELAEVKQKYLPIESYKKWFKAGIIDEKVFKQIAEELEFSDKDIKRMIAEVSGS